jgi:hypothetical protein
MDLDHSGASAPLVENPAVLQSPLQVAIAGREMASPLETPSKEVVGWVECRRCGKWRMLEKGVNDWRGAFYCEMNKWAPNQDACHKLEDPVAVTPGSPSKSSALSPGWKGSDCVRKRGVVDFDWRQCTHCKFYYVQNHLVSSEDAIVAAKNQALSAEASGCVECIVSGNHSPICEDRKAFLEEQGIQQQRNVQTDTKLQTQPDSQKDVSRKEGSHDQQQNLETNHKEQQPSADRSTLDPVANLAAQAPATEKPNTIPTEAVEPAMTFELKQLVTVLDRTGHGQNKQGGAARIAKCNADGTYNIKYVLGGGEKK